MQGVRCHHGGNVREVAAETLAKMGRISSSRT
jgi:hypothetical protein